MRNTSLIILIISHLLLSIEVEARDPDERRSNFLFEVNTERTRNNDDLYDTNYYDEYHDEQSEIEIEIDSNSSIESKKEEQQIKFVKEYNPSLSQSLTDEIYDQHNNNFDGIEEVRIKPSFLQESSSSPSMYDDIHRVILWYNPYCAHCQRFKSTYVRLAQETKQATEVKGKDGKEKQNIEFHAISCSAHHWLCKEFGIKGFPIVWVYKKKSLQYEYDILKDYTVHGLAKILDLTLDTTVHIGSENQTEQQQPQQLLGDKKNSGKATSDSHVSSTLATTAVENDTDGDDEDDIIDILGASNDIHKRTRSDIFHDAAISLIHSITSRSYNAKDDNKNEKEEILSEYYDLLYWSLPSSWKLLTIVNDVRFNLKEYTSASISTSQTEIISTMITAVESHKSFVLNNALPEWTQSCKSHRSGYECGLWNLFHIISIGVAERHKAVLGARNRISTEYVALTLKQYVSNFLLDDNSDNDEKSKGKLSRNDYWNMFLDICNRDCGYREDVCTRFRIPPGKKINEYYHDNNHWREFALWLWEIHNEIDLQLFRRQMEEKGAECCTKEEERKILYPSSRDCSDCQSFDGTWQRDKVYDYLKTEYWPSGIHNFRYVVLDVKEEKYDSKDKRFGSTHILKGAIFSIIIGLLFRYNKRKRFLKDTGLRKKCDD